VSCRQPVSWTPGQSSRQLTVVAVDAGRDGDESPSYRWISVQNYRSEADAGEEDETR
jgi:hypothetical protein